METPQYKVLADSFMEPNHVKAGSIIRTWGPPGPHLEPMNESANTRMEEWYNEEHDEIDPKTGKATGQKVKPHLKYRLKSNFADPSERHAVELVAGPTRDQPGSLSLAETLANSRTSTDQRPPPLSQFRQTSTAPVAAAIPEVVPATDTTRTETPPPTMGDAPISESAIPEIPPTPATPEAPAVTTSAPGGNLSGETPQPEPEATEVVFSAPPPSAKRIG